MAGRACDVLVIGGGLSGLQAAEVAAQFVGNVLLLDKAASGEAPASLRDATLLAAYLAQDAGGVSDWKSTRVHLGPERQAGRAAEDEATLAAQRRGFEAFLREIASFGQGLADPTLAEYTAVGVYNRIGWLESYGLRLARTPEGAYRGFPGLGHSADRVALLAESPGEVLRRIGASGERFGVERIRGLAVTRLVADREGVAGAVGVDLASGACVPIQAGAVILACGGADRLYRSEAGGSTGDGFQLALDAGAELANLEFVAFGAELAVEGAFPADLPSVLLGLGAALETGDGEAAGSPRDPAAWARTLAEAPIRLRVPRDALRALADLPWAVPLRAQLEKPVGLRLGCRGLLGGVVHRVFDTGVPGLFVAGALATGCHGADLLPGLATAAALYSAENAASAAVAHSTRHRRRELPGGALRDEERRLAARAGGRRAPRPGELAELEGGIRERLWAGASVPRSASGLESALAGVGELRERLAALGSAAPRDLVPLLELENLAAAAELVCRAALAREETRGQHVRLDHPRADARQGSSWIGVRRSQGSLQWRRFAPGGDGE